MKSLIVLNVMLSKDLGGIEQSFIDYLTAFNNLKYKTIGIISKAAKITEKIPHDTKIEKIFNFGEWDIFAVMRLKKIISKIQPDIIIVHGRRAAKLIKSAVTTIPIIGVTHNYTLNYLLDLDYVFATTQDLAYHLVELGYDKTKIFHVPNMININSARTKFKSSQIKFRNPPIIGAIGRFVKKKGFDLLIKSLSILKDEGIKFKAVIAGSGEEEASLKELVHELGLTELITFPAWVKDKEKFFSSIDIFCLPSIHEPFGLVLLEALLYGKPTISFKSEGPSEIGTDNKTLLFATLGDTRDLAEKIKSLLANQTLAVKLAKTGNALIKEKYSINMVQKSLDKYIQKIISFSA